MGTGIITFPLSFLLKYCYIIYRHTPSDYFIMNNILNMHMLFTVGLFILVSTCRLSQ